MEHRKKRNIEEKFIKLILSELKYSDFGFQSQYVKIL